MVARLIQESVDLEDAAKMLCCSKSYICTLVKQNRLKSIKHAGKRRIWLDSIDAYATLLKNESMGKGK